MSDKIRFHYLDNLKVFLIILVIVHHVGQAYGNTGGFWYFTHPGEKVPNLGFFFFFNASFFMGLFFFISGYFFPGAFDRHGARKFLIDKHIRFGIPILIGMFVLVPYEMYMYHIHYLSDKPFFSYYLTNYLGIGPKNEFWRGPDANFGHLWFVEHLLIYSTLYTLYRIIADRFFPSFAISKPRKLRLYAIIIFIFALGFVTDYVRNPMGFPIDRWIAFLGFIQMEVAHYPQYGSLFFLGIFAYRTQLLDSITMKKNILWLIPGIGIFLFTVIRSKYIGHAAFRYWEYREALLCVGVCIGLLALFRTLFNRSSSFLSLLSSNAFGAYIVHVPIVTILQYLVLPASKSAVPPFIIVSVFSVALSFAASAALRLIPGVKRVI